jgi:hypothetical protein
MKKLFDCFLSAEYIEALALQKYIFNPLHVLPGGGGGCHYKSNMFTRVSPSGELLLSENHMCRDTPSGESPMRRAAPFGE